ncbi:MAG: flagellar hook-length control protein FliK [Thermodesulfobacteriota bacterium]
MQRGSESQPLKLAPHQIVQATVAEGGLERVVLHVGRHRMDADTRVPLKAGQKLNLQVQRTSPHIHFRIIEAAELRHLFRSLTALGENIKLLPLLSQLRGGGQMGSNFFGLPEDTRSALSGLMQLLKADPSELSGNQLARLWRGLGLDLEALLAGGKNGQARAGAKAALFMGIEALQDRDMATEPFEKALEQLNLFQLCRHRLGRENVFFLPLPLPFLEQGYLLAEPDPDSGADGSKKDRVWKMTLNLKLSGLGNLQIRLLFEGKTLSLRVLCDDADRAKTISAALPRLREQLSTVSLAAFSVDTGAEAPVEFLARRLAPDGDHFLEAEV